MKKLISVLLCVVLALSLACPAFASETPISPEAAGAILREQGIYQGDGSGDLMLDKGLTQAELAAILTRLHGEGQVDPNHFTWVCYFKDVPEWAKPYVGYCVANLLVAGYNVTQYGPNDMVTPAMACTVMLRSCGYESDEGSLWTYGTACEYAVSLGLLSRSTAQAPIITRGEMAVLICRALNRQSENAPPQAVTVPSGYQSSPGGGVTISQNSWSREDFSQQADPDVFTATYDQALYNAIRQTLVDGAPGETPAYTMVFKADYSAVAKVLGRMDNTRWLEYYVPQNFTDYWRHLDYFAVSAEMPENYQVPFDFIQPTIQATDGMTDREKVEYLNDYLCTLLA